MTNVRNSAPNSNNLLSLLQSAINSRSSNSTSDVSLTVSCTQCNHTFDINNRNYNSAVQVANLFMNEHKSLAHSTLSDLSPNISLNNRG